MAHDNVSDELWEEFHRVVNMTSRELREWMMAESASEDAESLPDRAGTPIGHQVADILGKRRSDVTDDDLEVMNAVVDTVHRERGDELEPTAGDAAWRRRLMGLGHDPLKPADR